MKLVCHVPGLGHLSRCNAPDDFWADVRPHLQSLDGAPFDDLVIQPMERDRLREEVIAARS